MKKGFIALFITFMLIYGYQGFNLIYKYYNDDIKIRTYGKLSNISNDITAIPLETLDADTIKQIKHVSRDGENIFLLKDQKLLHFDISGKYINQIAKDITENNGVYLADYTLDTDNHRIIVVDSMRNVTKYDYEGNLIACSQIKNPWYKLTAIAYHKGFLWATAESIIDSNDGDQQPFIEYCIYQLDADMNEISHKSLKKANAVSGCFLETLYVTELAADENGIYAYTPPSNTENILEDTLQIIGQDMLPVTNTENDEIACIYPVRKGKRYMISSHNNHTPDGDGSFTFCYDRTEHIAYKLADGFDDDVYNTGHIQDFQPIDIYNNSYCFIKSGKDLNPKLSDKYSSSDAVLFIVNLNS